MSAEFEAWLASLGDERYQAALQSAGDQYVTSLAKTHLLLDRATLRQRKEPLTPEQREELQSEVRVLTKELRRRGVDTTTLGWRLYPSEGPFSFRADLDVATGEATHELPRQR